MGNYQNPDTLIKTIMSRSFSLSSLAIKAHLLLIKLVITNMKENKINLENSVKAHDHFTKKLYTKSSEIISLANDYGYNITLEDLRYDETAINFEAWIIKSCIAPLRPLF